MMSVHEEFKKEHVTEVLDSLPLERRITLFASLSPKAREAFIRSVSHPEEILCRVSEEELFYTVKQLGEDNARGLLTHCISKQLLYFVDLEFWKKDMMDFTTVARWLRILTRLGQEKVVQFVNAVEPDLLLTVLRLFVHVEAKDSNLDIMDQSDSLPTFTLDGTFFVEFFSSDLEEDIKFFFETIFYSDSEYYFGLMVSLTSGLRSENEEMALKWHRARLADKGFPVFEEALEIYAYLQRTQVLSPIHHENLVPDALEDYPRPLLRYPLMVLPQNNLFRRSLDEIGDAGQRDRIITELAHVANKVMVADARDPGNPEDLYSSLRKVSGYINIALEDFCGEDLSLASHTLLSNHMEMLFRRGFSLILDLRKQAQKFVRKYDGGLENLGHPLSGLIRGLFQKRPLFSEEFLGETKERDFQSLSDLQTISLMLDKELFEERWEPI